jgi:hypothetical protein
MANSSERLHPGEPAADPSQRPYLGLRVDHRFAPGRDETASNVIGEILARPCFASIHRVALEFSDDDHAPYDERSAAVMAGFLRDERCATLIGRASWDSEVSAIFDIETGRYREGLQGYPAPLISRAFLPHDPALAQARVQAFRDLGAVLQAVFGCISLEPTVREASHLTNGLPPHMPLQQVLALPWMSERRVRERHGFTEFPEQLGHSIPGPEWAIFLSPEHVARLAPAALQPGTVFARVERLPYGGVYAQLTDDPSDAMQPGFDALLDGARDALAPILMDTSGIELHESSDQ